MKIVGYKSILIFIFCGMLFAAFVFYIGGIDGLLYAKFFFIFLFIFLLIFSQILIIENGILRIYKFSILFRKKQWIELNSVDKVIFREQGNQMTFIEIIFIGKDLKISVEGSLSKSEMKTLQKLFLSLNIEVELDV